METVSWRAWLRTMSALFPVIRLWTNLSTNFPMTFFIIIIIIIIIILGVFFGYISNAIPKFPHTPPLPYPPTPTSWPWCSPVLRHIKFAWPMASLSIDGQLGHLLIHMQLESRAPGYWLVHNVVAPIGLQIPLAPWVLSLAPPLGALWSIH